MYETFRDSHEVYDADEPVVRDKIHVGRNRLAVLSNFFNMTSIDRILKQHRLLPHLSLEYVNRFHIRWIDYRITKKRKKK